MHSSRTLRILACVSLLSAAAVTDAQSILYGTTGGPSNPGNLYTVDPATGFATVVGPLLDNASARYAVTGIAFDGNGVLYGATSSNSPTGPNELVTINPMSGLVTVVGTFGISIADVTFNSANSTLYGAGAANANLYSINLGTGAAMLVGASGISTSAPFGGNGLAADSTGVVVGAPKSAAGNLYFYNTGSGAATTGPLLIGGPFGSNGSLGALAYSFSNTLYGVDINRSDATRPSELVTINTSTGAVVDVGTISDVNGAIPFFDAIVFSVPEPSTWLTGALSLGMIVFAFTRRLYRR